MIQVKGNIKNFYTISDTKTGIQYLSPEWKTEDGAVLVGYGPMQSAFDTSDIEVVQKEVTRMMGPEAEVVDIFAWNWQEDEFAQGTWNVYRPGQMSRFVPKLLDESEHQRIFFAGDYLASGWNGFMDGAIETGLKTGRKVSQLITQEAESHQTES